MTELWVGTGNLRLILYSYYCMCVWIYVWYTYVYVCVKLFSFGCTWMVDKFCSASFCWLTAPVPYHISIVWSGIGVSVTKGGGRIIIFCQWSSSCGSWSITITATYLNLIIMVNQAIVFDLKYYLIFKLYDI